MNEPYATYVFRGTYDLHGKVILCPYGCKLRIKKGSLIKNGSISGNNTTIIASNRVRGFFNNIFLKGSFNNRKSYLSWWDFKSATDDVSDAIQSLVGSCGKCVVLDRPGIIKKRILDEKGICEVINGCENEFSIIDIPGYVFDLSVISKIEIKNIKLVFEGCNSGNSSHMGGFCVTHSDRTRVFIHDITISGYDNSKEIPCGFDGIEVKQCSEETITIINNISVHDIIVKGDGVGKNGVGSNYAVSVSCHEPIAGKVEIYNCTIKNMYNVDCSGKMVYEDTSGIYIGGAYGKNPDGTLKCADWDCCIHDCFFEDVSKRNIKIQGNCIEIFNILSNVTDDFLKDYQNMYIGAEGNNLSVRNIKGRYDGTIIKITGDYLDASNIECESNLNDAYYARVFSLDGCLHAEIKRVIFHNSSYFFLFPSEKGMSNGIVPEYTISDVDISVKHLIYAISNIQPLYEKGRLNIEQSRVNLASSFCNNSQSLELITFKDSQIRTKGRQLSYKGERIPRLVIKDSELFVDKGNYDGAIFSGAYDFDNVSIEIEGDDGYDTMFAIYSESFFSNVIIKNAHLVNRFFFCAVQNVSSYYSNIKNVN